MTSTSASSLSSFASAAKSLMHQNENREEKSKLGESNCLQLFEDKKIDMVPLGVTQTALNGELKKQSDYMDEIEQIKTMGENDKLINSTRRKIRDNQIALLYINQIASLESLYSNLSITVAQRSFQMAMNDNKALTRGRKLLSAPIHSCWKHLDQFSQLSHLHLKNSIDFHQFYVDCHEIHGETKTRAAMLSKKVESQHIKSEEFVLLLKETLNQYLHYWQRSKNLKRKSYSIVPIYYRVEEKYLNHPIKGVVVFTYESEMFSIKSGEEVFIVNTSQKDIWHVRKSTGEEIILPSICVWIPPADSIAIKMIRKIGQKIAEEWGTVICSFRRMALQLMLKLFEHVNKFKLIDSDNFKKVNVLMLWTRNLLACEQSTHFKSKIDKFIVNIQKNLTPSNFNDASIVQHDLIDSKREQRLLRNELAALKKVFSFLQCHLKQWNLFYEDLLRVDHRDVLDRQHRPAGPNFQPFESLFGTLPRSNHQQLVDFLQRWQWNSVAGGLLNDSLEAGLQTTSTALSLSLNCTNSLHDIDIYGAPVHHFEFSISEDEMGDEVDQRRDLRKLYGQYQEDKKKFTTSLRRRPPTEARVNKLDVQVETFNCTQLMIQLIKENMDFARSLVKRDNLEISHCAAHIMMHTKNLSTQTAAKHTLNIENGAYVELPQAIVAQYRHQCSQTSVRNVHFSACQPEKDEHYLQTNSFTTQTYFPRLVEKARKWTSESVTRACQQQEDLDTHISVQTHQFGEPLKNAKVSTRNQTGELVSQTLTVFNANSSQQTRTTWSKLLDGITTCGPHQFDVSAQVYGLIKPTEWALAIGVQTYHFPCNASFQTTLMSNSKETECQTSLTMIEHCSTAVQSLLITSLCHSVGVQMSTKKSMKNCAVQVENLILRRNVRIQQYGYDLNTSDFGTNFRNKNVADSLEQMAPLLVEASLSSSLKRVAKDYIFNCGMKNMSIYVNAREVNCKENQFQSVHEMKKNNLEENVEEKVEAKKIRNLQSKAFDNIMEQNIYQTTSNTITSSNKWICKPAQKKEKFSQTTRYFMEDVNIQTKIKSVNTKKQSKECQTVKKFEKQMKTQSTSINSLKDTSSYLYRSHVDSHTQETKINNPMDQSKTLNCSSEWISKPVNGNDKLCQTNLKYEATDNRTVICQTPKNKELKVNAQCSSINVYLEKSSYFYHSMNDSRSQSKSYEEMLENTFQITSTYLDSSSKCNFKPAQRIEQFCQTKLKKKNTDRMCQTNDNEDSAEKVEAKIVKNLQMNANNINNTIQITYQTTSTTLSSGSAWKSKISHLIEQFSQTENKSPFSVKSDNIKERSKECQTIKKIEKQIRTQSTSIKCLLNASSHLYGSYVDSHTQTRQSKYRMREDANQFNCRTLNCSSEWISKLAKGNSKLCQTKLKELVIEKQNVICQTAEKIKVQMISHCSPVNRFLEKSSYFKHSTNDSFSQSKSNEEIFGHTYQTTSTVLNSSSECNIKPAQKIEKFTQTKIKNENFDNDKYDKMCQTTDGKDAKEKVGEKDNSLLMKTNSNVMVQKIYQTSSTIQNSGSEWMLNSKQKIEQFCQTRTTHLDIKVQTQLKIDDTDSKYDRMYQTTNNTNNENAEEKVRVKKIHNLQMKGNNININNNMVQIAFQTIAIIQNSGSKWKSKSAKKIEQFSQTRLKTDAIDKICQTTRNEYDEEKVKEIKMHNFQVKANNNVMIHNTYQTTLTILNSSTESRLKQKKEIEQFSQTRISNLDNINQTKLKICELMFQTNDEKKAEEKKLQIKTNDNIMVQNVYQTTLTILNSRSEMKLIPIRKIEQYSQTRISPFEIRSKFQTNELDNKCNKMCQTIYNVDAEINDATGKQRNLQMIASQTMLVQNTRLVQCKVQFNDSTIKFDMSLQTNNSTCVPICYDEWCQTIDQTEQTAHKNLNVEEWDKPLTVADESFKSGVPNCCLSQIDYNDILITNDKRNQSAEDTQKQNTTQLQSNVTQEEMRDKKKNVDFPFQHVNRPNKLKRLVVDHASQLLYTKMSSKKDVETQCTAKLARATTQHASKNNLQLAVQSEFEKVQCRDDHVSWVVHHLSHSINQTSTNVIQNLQQLTWNGMESTCQMEDKQLVNNSSLVNNECCYHFVQKDACNQSNLPPPSSPF